MLGNAWKVFALYKQVCCTYVYSVVLEHKKALLHEEGIPLLPQQTGQLNSCRRQEILS